MKYFLVSKYKNEDCKIKLVLHTVAGDVSNCLPPWLETNTPLHPKSAAIFASVAFKIPFTIIGKLVML